MSFNKDNMLNIGSIVRIRGSVPLIMVIGYTTIKNDTLYDYIGCFYPVGIIDNKSRIIFSSSDIKEVIDNGYMDESTISFKEQYIDSLDKLDNIDKYKKNQKVFEDAKKKLPEIVMFKELLPIGSIVKVRFDPIHKYMITSKFIKTMKGKKKGMYQYMASMYPIGIVNKDANFFFDDDDITDIYYFGYTEDKKYLGDMLNQYILSGKKIHLDTKGGK